MKLPPGAIPLADGATLQDVLAVIDEHADPRNPTREWELEIHGRPHTLNVERSGHWRTHRQRTRATRDTVAILARAQKIPSLDRVAIDATPILRDRRTQDVGACFPTAKAAIDGLVDAGVLPDDTPLYVVRLTFHAPELAAGRDALRLTIREIP